MFLILAAFGKSSLIIFIHSALLLIKVTVGFSSPGENAFLNPEIKGGNRYMEFHTYTVGDQENLWILGIPTKLPGGEGT